jgi:uncharacterized membrane protein
VFSFLSKQIEPAIDESAVLGAIRQAESLSRAEIRVHIAQETNKDGTLETAKRVFAKLGMHRTELRNGVLIFVCFREKKFAILGDIGIHQYVSDDFWETVKSEMQEFLKQGRHTDAICHGVQRAGEKLHLHFPAGDNNPNELSNEISRD